MTMLKERRVLPSDIWKEYLLRRNIVSADTPQNFWPNAKRGPKKKAAPNLPATASLLMRAACNSIERWDLRKQIELYVLGRIYRYVCRSQNSLYL